MLVSVCFLLRFRFIWIVCLSKLHDICVYVCFVFFFWGITNLSIHSANKMFVFAPVQISYVCNEIHFWGDRKRKHLRRDKINNFNHSLEKFCSSNGSFQSNSLKMQLPGKGKHLNLSGSHRRKYRNRYWNIIRLD